MRRSLSYAAVTRDERNAADGLFPNLSDVVHEAVVLFFLYPHLLPALTKGLQGHAGKEGIEELTGILPHRLGDAVALEGAFEFAFRLFFRGAAAIRQKHVLFGGVQDLQHRDLFRCWRS